MATLLTYNGIQLEMLKTNGIHRTPVFSPDGTDYMYTHVMIDVTAVYNPGATSYDDTGAPSNDNLPAETDANIRHALSQPRAPLVLSVGADQIYNINGVDANNGPIPKKINIERITGDATFYVSFAVEFWINECPGGNQAPVLLTNRWQVQDNVDENFLTTKVTRGVAVLRTDLLIAAGNSPDHFRDQVFPPIPLGFRRVKISATMHPSLNSLSYEVVDQEQVVHIGGPRNQYGVTHFEGFYQQSTTSGTEGGAASGLAGGQVDVKVYGERDSSNWQLTLFAIRIIFQKLQLDGAAKDVPVLRGVAIRQALHARYVEAQANVLISPSNDKNGISILNIVQLNMDDLAVFAKDFTDPQPYDKGTRGAYQWEMVAQKLKESCGKASAILNPPTQINNTSTPYDSTTPTKVNIGVSDDVPYTNNNKYSTDVYSDYKIDTKYVTDYSKIHAPVANPIISGSYQGSQNSSVMTVASPMTKKVIHWTAEKFGDQPKIPNSQPGDSNLTLLSDDIQVAAPAPMPDTSSPIYRISGTYVYAMTTPRQSGDALKTGILPWTTFSFSDGQYNAFTDGILDIGSSGGSSTGTNN